MGLLKANQQMASPPALLGADTPRPEPLRPGAQACGADNCLHDVSLRSPDLYRYLKLPVSFSALFERSSIVLLADQRFAVIAWLLFLLQELI